MNGKGTFKWTDGRKYVGGFINDIKNGFGKFYWPGGKRYEGEWKNGKQNGKGVLYTRKGSKSGIWKDGKLEKKIAKDLDT